MGARAAQWIKLQLGTTERGRATGMGYNNNNNKIFDPVKTQMDFPCLKDFDQEQHLNTMEGIYIYICIWYGQLCRIGSTCHHRAYKMNPCCRYCSLSIHFCKAYLIILDW